MIKRLQHEIRADSNSTNSTANFGSWAAGASYEVVVVEGWSQGFMLGALVIMACITVSNMRKGILARATIAILTFTRSLTVFRKPSAQINPHRGIALSSRARLPLVTHV